MIVLQTCIRLLTNLDLKASMLHQFRANEPLFHDYGDDSFPTNNWRPFSRLASPHRA